MDDEQSAKFIEDKLIEHGQALEQLLEMVNRNEELTKQLLSILSSKLEAPKLPEKLEVVNYNRRSYNGNHNDAESTESAILRFGKRIPAYGKLFKNVILRHIQDNTDPTPFIDHYYNY